MKPVQILDLARQISFGMKYLEETHILHRRLAASSVFVTDKGICKIADFSAARDTDVDCKKKHLNISSERKLWYFSGNLFIHSQVNDAASESLHLMKRWLAMECFEDIAKFTSKSDVWSFGVLLWEIYTADTILPFAEG